MQKTIHLSSFVDIITHFFEKYYFIIACILTIILRLDTLFVTNIEWDEANQMTMAFFANHGFLIYKDFFAEHPFLDMLFFNLFFKIFNNAIAPKAIHFANIIVILIKLYLINNIFNKINIKNTLYKASSLFLIVLLYSQPWAKASYGEFYTSILTLAIIYLIFFKQRLQNKYLMIGVLFTLSFFTKQTAIFDVIAIFTASIIFKKDLSLVFNKKTLSSFFLGVIVTFFVIVLYLQVKGILDTALFHIFIFPITYITKGYHLTYINNLGRGIISGMIRIINYAPTFFVFWFVSSILIIKEYLSNKQSQQNIFLLFLVIYSYIIFFCIQFMGRFYEHYLIPLFIPQGLIIPYFIIYKMPRIIKIAALLILTFTIMTFVPTTISFYHITNNDIEFQSLTKYITTHTSPNDRIFVLSKRIDLYYLTKRKGTYRTHQPSGIFNMPYNPLIHNRYKERFLRELKATPPKFIIYQEDFVNNLLTSQKTIDKIICKDQYRLIKEYCIDNVYDEAIMFSKNKIKVSLYERPKILNQKYFFSF